MGGELELRPLRREDDRATFRSGHPQLDRFFHQYAGQNQFRLHVAVTHVAILDGRLVGFATVSGGTLERALLPDERLRRRLPSYPLPVVRLARFAVDERFRERGIGRALLRHVLALALAHREAMGCVGLVVDAKREAVPFYAGLGFFPLEGIPALEPDDPLPMFLSLETLARCP
jgi:GNAT superfamily N-acetyltransferase